MPGVPSSRACDECRRHRKKCQTTNAMPKCARCQRLAIPCVGRGIRRFKFMDEGKKLVVRNGPPTANGSGEPDISNKSFTLPGPSYNLSNELTRLIAAFVSNIDASADIRIQLPWNFGDFLTYIPQRLGTNDALDAASQDLVTAYDHFIAGDVVASPDVLTAHSNALSALRRCLDDPVKAYSSETLCSTMVLMIVQTLPGLNGSLARSHSVGAAQVLKGRGYTGPKNDLESKLLLSLRGPVAIEGLINSQVSMTPEQWRDLVYNPIDGDTPDGQMMKCLAHLPDLMQRGRHTLRSPTLPASSHMSIQKEMHALRDSFLPQLKSLRERWEATDSNVAMQYPEFIRSKAIIHAHYSRSYGMALAVGIILNCMLAALGYNPAEMSKESTQFSHEVVNLAETVCQYRPLGTIYMVFCLSAAWVGDVGQTKRQVIEKWLFDYLTDIKGPSPKISPGWPDFLEKRFYLH